MRATSPVLLLLVVTTTTTTTTTTAAEIDDKTLPTGTHSQREVKGWSMMMIHESNPSFDGSGVLIIVDMEETAYSKDDNHNDENDSDRMWTRQEPLTSSITLAGYFSLDDNEFVAPSIIGDQIHCEGLPAGGITGRKEDNERLFSVVPPDNIVVIKVENVTFHWKSQHLESIVYQVARENGLSPMGIPMTAARNGNVVVVTKQGYIAAHVPQHHATSTNISFDIYLWNHTGRIREISQALVAAVGGNITESAAYCSYDEDLEKGDEDACTMGEESSFTGTDPQNHDTLSCSKDGPGRCDITQLMVRLELDINSSDDDASSTSSLPSIEEWNAALQEVIVKQLEIAQPTIRRWSSTRNVQISSTSSNGHPADGLVVSVILPSGSVVLVWDGSRQIDLHLYLPSASMHSHIDAFVEGFSQGMGLLQTWRCSDPSTITQS